jgi:hypothetical protein
MTKRKVSLVTKKPKGEVDYSPGHKESHCGPVSADDKGYCKHFRRLYLLAKYSSGGSCVKVLGGVKRMYWCKLFEKAE